MLAPCTILRPFTAQITLMSSYQHVVIVVVLTLRGCTQCPSELDDFQNRRTSTRPSHSTSISPVEKGFCSKKRVDLPTQRRTGKHFVLQSRRIPPPTLSGFKIFLRPIENQLKTGRLQAFDSTCALGGVPVPTLGSRKDISEKV